MAATDAVKKIGLKVVLNYRCYAGGVEGTGLAVDMLGVIFNTSFYPLFPLFINYYSCNLLIPSL